MLLTAGRLVLRSCTDSDGIDGVLGHEELPGGQQALPRLVELVEAVAEGLQPRTQRLQMVLLLPGQALGHVQEVAHPLPRRLRHQLRSEVQPGGCGRAAQTQGTPRSLILIIGCAEPPPRPVPVPDPGLPAGGCSRSRRRWAEEVPADPAAVMTAVEHEVEQAVAQSHRPSEVLVAYDPDRLLQNQRISAQHEHQLLHRRDPAQRAVGVGQHVSEMLEVGHSLRCGDLRLAQVMGLRGAARVPPSAGFGSGDVQGHRVLDDNHKPDADGSLEGRAQGGDLEEGLRGLLHQIWLRSVPVWCPLQ